MPVQDQSGRWIDVGDPVMVPGVVTAITTGPSPTVTIQTKYAGIDGNLDNLSALYANQVLENP